MLCFGSTQYGQLGLNTTGEQQKPMPTRNRCFDEYANVKQIAVGLEHTLFLLADGTVFSCGNNNYNQLGRNGTTSLPERIKNLDAYFIIQVACGRSFSLALNKMGQLFFWGSLNGQRNEKDGYYFDKPTRLPLNFESMIIQIACGYNFFLILTNDGNVFVMGMNEFGQLGLGNQTPTNQLVHLKSIHGMPISQIACGGYHSLILTVSGNIFAFGHNDFGQLGFGNVKEQFYPELIKSMSQLEACYLACGEDFSAVLTKDGGVFTFGAGTYGQLGHDGDSHEHLPRKICDLMGTEVTQIACGRGHMLAYQASTNRLYSFGLNLNGQLGIGTLDKSKTNLASVKCQMANVKCKDSTNLIALNHHTLYSIYAGGDQSFLLCSNVSKIIEPNDYRFITSKNHILTLNFLEEFTNRPSSYSKINSKHLQVILKSASCINASFLDAENHHKTSNHYSGVDLEQVDKIKKFLLKTNDLDLRTKIVTQLVQLFDSWTVRPPSIEALRLYMTVPHLVDFNENNAHVHSLLTAYAQSINRLDEKSAGRVLEHWFSKWNKNLFNIIVQSYKNYVIQILNQTRPADDNEKKRRENILVSSMKFLKKLNKINLEFKEIVPFSTFYIDELEDKIEIDQDYINSIRSNNSDQFAFCKYPFIYNGGAKSMLLQAEANIRQSRAVQENVVRFILMPTTSILDPFLVLHIRRTHIVQDTLNQLSQQVRDDLKKPLKIMFNDEEGVDAGGVTKEFFMLLMREILDLKYGMFNYYDETHTIWFNDQTFEESDMFYLIGEICGLAIYNSNIIDLPFPLALYKKLLKEKPNLQDMYDLSPSIGRSLDTLLKYVDDDFKQVFNLTFEITRTQFDETKDVELVPGGSKKAVTSDNRFQYVDAYIDFIFNKSVEMQFNAFSDGFHHVCSSKILEFFHPSELMAMIIGNQNYDFNEFEKNAEYKGDYNANHPVIRNFWKVFHSLSLDEKKKFLEFLTGTNRIPILGMKQLKIIIQSTNSGDSFYPVAHTCFNLLDLPKYSSERILKERLLVAIQHTQGFTLV